MDTIIQPVIPGSKRGRYRRHTTEFKRAVVARSLAGDVSVSRIARELNVNANQVFAWRRQFGGELAEAGTAEANKFLPVMVTDVVAAARPAVDANDASSGVMTLNIGQVQLRLEGKVDAAALTLLLARLLP